MKFGRLICLEGIEGTGKTTLVHFIHQYLEKKLGEPVVTTREPGGTPLAESIRALILEAKKDQETIAPETELFLMFAARRQHIVSVIEPAIHKGQWVVCDRFTEASYAYQGGGRGLAYQLIETLESYTHQHLKIDRVLLLDMPPEAALERLNKTRYCKLHAVDRIESESFEFFKRVQESYLARAQKLPHMYRVINANTTLENVKAEVIKMLNEILYEWS